MCSIVILKKSKNEWPLIIAANRDEMKNRKALVRLVAGEGFEPSTFRL